MTAGLRIGVDAEPFAAEPAGIARYLTNMLRSLMQISPEDRYVLYARWDFDPHLPPGNWTVRVQRGGHFPGGSQWWLRRVLPQWVQRDGLDAYWGQGINMPLQRATRCFRVMTVHDLTSFLWPSTMTRRSWLKSRVYYGSAVRASDCVVAVSRATARLVQRLLRVERERIRVVYEGCDSHLQPRSRSEAQRVVRQHFGLSVPFLLSVSTVEPRKGYPTLLNALAKLPDAPPLAVVGGKGWRCAEIMERIRSDESKGKVRYLGRVADAELAALYSAATLLVYPSFYEGFGLPILEAMTCGCPVLCSWSSSLPEVGGHAARYFRTHDEADLAAKLKLLLEREHELRKMSRDGLIQAAGFSFRDAARKLLAIFREGVVARRR